MAARGFSAPYPGFTGPLNQALRPFPQYQGLDLTRSDNVGSSTYHSLQVKLERSSLKVSGSCPLIPWAKTLTDASSSLCPPSSRRQRVITTIAAWRKRSLFTTSRIRLSRRSTTSCRSGQASRSLTCADPWEMRAPHFQLDASITQMPPIKALIWRLRPKWGSMDICDPESGDAFRVLRPRRLL